MIIDCHNHLGVELQMYLGGDFPYAQQLTDLVREGRACGIDRWIVFPMVTNLALNLQEMRRHRLSPQGALESVPYEWENRRLMREVYELFPDEGRAAIPFAMFDPMRAVPLQIAALRQLKRDYGFHGLKLQGTMIQSPVKSLLREGRALLELAQEWDLPLLIHSSVLPSDEWAQARDILDVVAATPRIRFCVAHSCRFDRACLERLSHLPNCWFDCSAHGIHCQLATQNHPAVAPPARRFEADYARPGAVLCALAQQYPDKLLWGSDSPYQSFVSLIEGARVALRSSYRDEVSFLRALPAFLRQRASCDNILQFLGPRFEAGSR